MNPVLLDDSPPDQTHLTTKHMGCITGFLHLFDRNHHQHHKPHTISPPPPVTPLPVPSEKSPPDPPRPSLPVPLLEPSRTPWKLRDSPRLSLDSRFPPREIRTVRSPSDGSDLDRRSPSVVARLMGLDALPSDLRRSSSASAALAAAAPPPAPPPPPRDVDLEALRDVLEALQLKGLLRAGDGKRDPIVVMRPAPPPPRSHLTSDPRPRKDHLTRTPRRRPPPAAPRRRPPAADDPCTPSCCEREKTENRRGRKLLERCDRLLSSIAEISEVGGIAADRQPSPVSVLDCGAEFAAASPPSPSQKPKRSLAGFKKPDRTGRSDRLDREPAPTRSVQPVLDRTSETHGDQRTAFRGQLLVPIDASEAADGDFLYVAKVLAIAERTTKTVDENVFCSLEKEHQKPEPSKASKALRLHRRLVFDAVAEIVEEKKRPPSPWEAFARSPSLAASAASPRAIWQELKRIQKHVSPTDDLSESVSDALRKDIDEKGGEDARKWSGRASELSDVVLDIERLVFKDLVADAIRDLTSADLRWRLRATCRVPSPLPLRRRLVF